MAFIGYRRAFVRTCKIDWDVHVAITDELRRSLHPHDPEALRVGRLQRPFAFEPTHHSDESRVHGAGSLVFAYRDEHFYLIES